MRHRFFLPPGSIGKTGVLFPADAARQIRQVLRLHPGQSVVVLDGKGMEYSVLLEKITSEKVWGSLLGQQPATSEPDLQVVLYISLTQREKFEWALQKCAEVGASVFAPVISSRTLARDKDQAMQKMERWERILREASEQSGRGLVPLIRPPITLEEAFHEVSQKDLPAAFLWENESQHTLYGWLVQQLQQSHGIRPGRLGLFTGPEGGYSQEEADMAVQSGLRPVTLGRRILRMETAAVVSCALALQLFENL